MYLLVADRRLSGVPDLCLADDRPINILCSACDKYGRFRQRLEVQKSERCVLFTVCPALQAQLTT